MGSDDPAPRLWRGARRLTLFGRRSDRGSVSSDRLSFSPARTRLYALSNPPPTQGPSCDRQTISRAAKSLFGEPGPSPGNDAASGEKILENPNESGKIKGNLESPRKVRRRPPETG